MYHATVYDLPPTTQETERIITSNATNYHAVTIIRKSVVENTKAEIGKQEVKVLNKYGHRGHCEVKPQNKNQLMYA